jgi:hypothetical protein
VVQKIEEDKYAYNIDFRNMRPINSDSYHFLAHNYIRLFTFTSSVPVFVNVGVRDRSRILFGRYDLAIMSVKAFYLMMKGKSL